MKKLFIASLLLATTVFANHANAADKKPAQKEWTFLLFLNGHNNLDEYGTINMNQMEEIGSNENLNMVVQWASQSYGKTRRILVKKDNDTVNVTSPVVQSLDRVDMGDYKQLIEFVRWGVKKYPAKHYMIAVWNHGAGWHKFARDNAGRDISFDDNTNHKITTEELGLAMEESAKIIGHKVDIYGSDACLMAMAEIGAEMQSSVDYMVGSEDLEPGYGWPYSTWMARWEQNPTASAEDVSKYLTQEYIKAYDGGVYGNQPVTFSAMNLNYLPELMTSMKDLGASLTSLTGNDLQSAIKASSDAMGFYYSDYKDLGSMITKLAEAKTSIKENLISNVQKSLEKVVIENGATNYFVGATGLAVWLPTYQSTFEDYKDRYANLKFNQATNWIEYINMVSLGN